MPVKIGAVNLWWQSVWIQKPTSPVKANVSVGFSSEAEPQMENGTLSLGSTTKAMAVSGGEIPLDIIELGKGLFPLLQGYGFPHVDELWQ